MTGKKRAPRQKQKKIEEPRFLDNVDKHYLELEQKNSKHLSLIEKHLLDVKKRIRRCNIRPLYHQRNKFLRIYKDLLSRKDSLIKQTWKKQFLYDISPLLEKYAEIKKGTTSDTNITPTITTTTASSVEQLNTAFFARHRRHELLPPAPEMEECKNPPCQREPLLLIPREARLLCRKCGQFTKQLTSSSNGLHFGDEIDHNSSQHAYERKKNFKSFLSQFHVHAKEIPEKLLRELQRAFRNILVTSKSEIRCTRLKKWLKNSDEYRKYIDCSARIVNILNGRPVPRFTQEQIDKFVEMFVKTQLPFLHFKPSGRQNFLNSCYLMNKFTGILKLRHYQSAFPLLRHKKTLLDQDLVWAAICTDLEWHYEKSI